MRVLYIAGAEDFGGAANSFKEMVTQLHKRHNIECIIVTNQEQPETNAALDEVCLDRIGVEYGAAMESPSINTVRTIARFMRSYLRRLKNRKACKEIENRVDMKMIDLIHTNSARIDLGMMLGKRNRIKCVTHLREFGKEDFHCINLRPAYSRYMNKTNNAFIAISNSVRNAWAAKGVDLCKIHTIYNGIDTSDIKKASPFQKKEIKCAIVGGVVRAKGQHEIIEALAKIPYDIKKYLHIDIIGWGDKIYIEQLKSRINELGINDQVTFLGRRNDIHSLLAEYDVGFMCSRSEGFGRVTAEYMHAGLLVIASDTGANPELINDGESGLLYHYGNFEDLASKIEYAFSHPQECKMMAKRGKEFAAENFTCMKNADNIYNLYCNVQKDS